MGKNNKEENVTLEALLRLKRNERPTNDFWNAFENDFERRRLHALVERETIRRSIWLPLLKGAMVGLPALLLVSLAAFWPHADRANTAHFERTPVEETPVLSVVELAANASSQPSASAERQAAESTAQRHANQFVMDAITSDPEGTLGFRKVLYTPALRLSGASGASYVRDSLSSRNYEVTTADVKLGRNF